MISKITAKSALLVFVGLVCTGSHKAQLTCDNFSQLTKCMDQARAQGLTDVGIGDVNRSHGPVEGWANNMKSDQLLVGGGSFPPEVLGIDQKIAAIMPEAERILETSDWAKYPAWRAQYVRLYDQLNDMKMPAFQRNSNNAASARAQGFHGDNDVPLGGLHNHPGPAAQSTGGWCQVGSDGALVPCNN